MRKKVPVDVEGDKIILQPASTPRKGWSRALKRMHEAGEDAPLWPEDMDNNLLPPYIAS